jgi:signal transduction histidine kinase
MSASWPVHPVDSPATCRSSELGTALGRTPPEKVTAMVQMIAETPLVTEFLESYPGQAVIVDANRQIVACNRKALELFGSTENEIFGKRLGEAIGCIHSGDTPAGCGTSRFCTACDAGKTVRFSTDERLVGEEECRVTARRNGREHAFDLRVRSSPIAIGGQPLTLLAIQDIAGEKRREALEHIFFHDVLNTANVLVGLSHLVPRVQDPDRLKHISERLIRSSIQLIEEIEAQRDLTKAERGSLLVHLRRVPVDQIVTGVYEIYTTSPLAEGKQIFCESVGAEVTVETDPVLAIRSLGNLVKNALEAAAPGQEVRISVLADTEVVAFDVTNPGVMPEEVQLQVFQRSFSSKAPRGRGTGTYSVKLIVEQYLSGMVSFVSEPETGTTFTVRLPITAS